MLRPRPPPELSRYGARSKEGLVLPAFGDLDVDYVRLQESGVRSAALELTGSTLEISGDPFALTVRPYAQDIVHAAVHRPDLRADGRSYVYVDHGLRGVGTAACGPGVLEQYRLKPREADFMLTFRVRS